MPFLLLLSISMLKSHTVPSQKVGLRNIVRGGSSWEVLMKGIKQMEQGQPISENLSYLIKQAENLPSG